LPGIKPWLALNWNNFSVSDLTLLFWDLTLLFWNKRCNYWNGKDFKETQLSLFVPRSAFIIKLKYIKGIFSLLFSINQFVDAPKIKITVCWTVIRENSLTLLLFFVFIVSKFSLVPQYTNSYDTKKSGSQEDTSSHECRYLLHKEKQNMKRTQALKKVYKISTNVNIYVMLGMTATTMPTNSHIAS
jgi:hypothetical protein